MASEVEFWLKAGLLFNAYQLCESESAATDNEDRTRDHRAVAEALCPGDRQAAWMPHSNSVTSDTLSSLLSLR